MNIVTATERDFEFIRDRDHHIEEKLILQKIRAGQIYILISDDLVIGWMRFGHFWDSIPFMNMLWIDEPYRNKGLGRQVVHFWEKEMKNQGFRLVMTSTQSDEGSQHFYRKLGYRDAGCFLFDTQPLEIILTKRLTDARAY